MSDVFWCKNCLNVSTRPRITFDEKGWCNACQWMEEKKTFSWDDRKAELLKVFQEHKSSSGQFDCLVPVSGGKDGSYVSHQLKHVYGMNPLAVTVTPPLSLELGDKNLKNYIKSGYNHIQVNANPKAMQKLDKLGFIEKGFPYYGWLTGILSAVLRVAINFNINLIFYGESGEVEYGGSRETKNMMFYNIDYMKRIYLEGGYDLVLKKVDIDDEELYFFKFPSDEECKKVDLKIAHWSYFENSDSYRNYIVAKEKCGLQENEETNIGTFTNFSQNDQALYALHTYLMYLKFGFGRATQDAGIEIRRGSMTRDQAKQLVSLYDNQYPEYFVAQYFEYYQMSKEEFACIIDKWANKKLFKKVDGRWQPKFTIE